VLTVCQAGNGLIYYQGDLKSANLVQRIFQEIYQGSQDFKKNYKTEPLYYQGEGFFKKETLLVDKQKLQILAVNKQLAIATGRVRAEADMVLKSFGIDSLFKVIITDDDVTIAERKPNPAMLYQAAEKIGGQKFLYVGDLPDDVRAANSAKDKLELESVYVGEGNNIEADYCFEDVNAFLAISCSNSNYEIQAP